MKNALKSPLLWPIFLCLIFFSFNSAQAFILDNSHTKSRDFCGKKGITITPLEESRQRGACEKFVESVGLIIIKSPSYTETHRDVSIGTGTLIEPGLMLTSAHVVADCIKREKACSFRFPDNSGSVFKKVYIPEAFIKTKAELQEVIGKVKSSPRPDQSLMARMRKLSLQVGEFDIAIVQLEVELKANSYLTLRSDSVTNLVAKKDVFAFGVSNGDILDNKNDNPVYELTRHINVVKLSSLGENKSLLNAEFPLPDDFKLQCDLGSAKTPRSFKYEKEKDHFLNSAPLDGDSGGPLIGKYGDSYQIIGLMASAIGKPCSEKNISALLAQWTPISSNMPWIKETLSEIAKK